METPESATNKTTINNDKESKKTDLISTPAEAPTPPVEEADHLMWFKFENRIRSVIKDLIGPTITRSQDNERKNIKLG